MSAQAALVLVLLAGLPAAWGAPAEPLAKTPSLSWEAPEQVRAGEQFSAVLRLSSHQPLRGLPLLLGFDTQTLQVVTVKEGEFFKQANGRTVFNQRVDASAGKIVVSVVRQSVSGRDPGINGAGGVVVVTFKALKAGTVAKLRLLSAAPDPAPGSPVAVPVERSVRVVR